MVAGIRSAEPPAARFYRHGIGEIELIALSDGGLNYPTAMILGNVPPEGAALYNLPEIQIFVPYTILLVKTKDGLLLIDVGASDQTVYNISDVVVDPLFVEHPEWAPAIVMDAGQADDARRLLFAQAAEEKALVSAHHLGPFPNLGRIVGVDDSWRWEPIETKD